MARSVVCRVRVSCHFEEAALFRAELRVRAVGQFEVLPLDWHDRDPSIQPNTESIKRSAKVVAA
jgi:hypothetical protein